MLFTAGYFFACKSAPKPIEQAQPEQEQPAAETVEVIETIETVETIEVPDTEKSAEDDADALAAFEKQRQDHQELGEILTQARVKRQEIMNDRLYETSQQRFDDADAALARATEAYDAGFDTLDKAVLDDGLAALSGFTAIIDEWWLAKAEAARDASAGIQQEALKLKADAAAKESYNLAAELHNKGETAFRSKDYGSAIDFYDDAVPVFVESIRIAGEKKARAELALEAAEKKISESEKLAEDAAKILENSAIENGENYDL
jgi:hypothetical protein